MNAEVAGHLLPREILEAASADLNAFLALYGDTLLLLVHVGDSDPELVDGLRTMALHGNAGTRLKSTSSAIEFKTALATGPLGRMTSAAARGQAVPMSLTKRLVNGTHFAVPLRKRAGADVLFMDRISVGRAHNKDVVLRHSSVSKFHAWFEVDDTGGFYLVDAASKNSTRVNGTALTAKERTPVQPGDLVRFGSIDAVLCSARELWTAVAGT